MAVPVKAEPVITHDSITALESMDDSPIAGDPMMTAAISNLDDFPSYWD